MQRGYSAHTKLRFTGLGNEAFGAKRSDLVVKFKQIQDKSGFVRDGDDLIFYQKVSLVDSFNPAPFTLKSLDGRTFTMTPNSFVTPQTTMVIPNEGMPRGETGTLLADALTSLIPV